MKIRKDLILKYLYQRGKPTQAQEIKTMFSISSPTLRNEIKDLNIIGEQSGFRILQKRNEGYVLIVEKEALLKNYLERQEQSLAIDLPMVRTNSIIMLLLQKAEFQTIDSISEYLMVGRSTVLSDLEEVEKQVQVFHLSLERKPHHGIRLVGDETCIRRAMSYFLNNAGVDLFKRENYLQFTERFPFKEMMILFNEEAERNHLKLSYIALENLIFHIQILAFRVLQKNFIIKSQEDFFSCEIVKPVYIDIARNICGKLSELYKVQIPESEIIYLAVHISGKTNADNLDKKEESELKQNLLNCLARLDQAFLTRFSDDEHLLKMLIFHMHPLLRRLHFDLKLSNPIIDDVYSRYSDVFVITLNFSEMIKEIWGFELSKDELGYIAMHFAVHMERSRHEQLTTFSKILLTYDMNESVADLLKIKLKFIFQDATIDLVPYRNFPFINQKDYDLLISTIPIENEKKKINSIQVAPILSESDLQSLRKKLAKYPLPINEREMPSLLSLFRPELFYIVSDEREYLDILKDCSNDVVSFGFATDEYPALVNKRELLMTTVYQGGIAGPHSMKMLAIDDTVSVALLKRPIFYEEKRVQMIFLINLRLGDLHLHKELARLMIHLIENVNVKNRLFEVDDFYDFQYEISRIILDLGVSK